MICPNCNSQLPDGGFFCPECGMRIPQNAAAVAAAAATEEPVNIAAAPVYSEPMPVQPEVPSYVAPVPVQPEAPSYVAPVPVQPEVPAYTPPAAPVEPAKPKKEKKVKEKSASGKKGGVVVTVILVILLAAALALNVWQYMNNGKSVEKLEDQISANEKTLEENKTTIAKLEGDVAKGEKTIKELSDRLSSGSSETEALNAQISDLNAKLEDLQKDILDRDSVITEQSNLINALEPFAQNYETILNELSGYNIGFAANHFSANRGAIVLSMSGKPKQFYLTANWPEGGSVFMDLSSYAADVSFDNDSWDTGTTMTVTPYEPGVCVATFSNNIDDNVFKVLIIVTE